MIFVQDTPTILGVELSQAESTAWRTGNNVLRREMKWRAVRTADERGCDTLHIYATDSETQISASKDSDGKWFWGFVTNSVLYSEAALAKRYGLPRGEE